MNRYWLHNREAIDVPDSLPQQVQLLWTDPPYGTGKIQRLGDHSYKDHESTEYVMQSVMRWSSLMAPDGVIAVCLDYRSSHLMVQALTSENWEYRGEVIWEFSLGRPRTSWWPVRHNNILTFTRPGRGKFIHERIPRVERRAPKGGYPFDKPIGSVWYRTMSNTDPERCGYPNQKPISVIEPFILCHTEPGDLVADPFMGSGSTGVAAIKNDRSFWGGDSNPEAVKIAHERVIEAGGFRE